MLYCFLSLRAAAHVCCHHWLRHPRHSADLVLEWHLNCRRGLDWYAVHSTDAVNTHIRSLLVGRRRINWKSERIPTRPTIHLIAFQFSRWNGFANRIIEWIREKPISNNYSRLSVNEDILWSTNFECEKCLCVTLVCIFIFIYSELMQQLYYCIQTFEADTLRSDRISRCCDVITDQTTKHKRKLINSLWCIIVIYKWNAECTRTRHATSGANIFSFVLVIVLQLKKKKIYFFHLVSLALPGHIGPHSQRIFLFFKKSHESVVNFCCCRLVWLKWLKMAGHSRFLFITLQFRWVMRCVGHNKCGNLITKTKWIEMECEMR